MSKSEDSIKSLKVLVVDDQIEIRTMLRGMLSELGITQIFEAADGKRSHGLYGQCNGHD
jgi:CheY-like chemotaxis protein